MDLQKHQVNPVVKVAWALGIPPPGDALLETTGRRTGQPRCTPVCDGLDGPTFWLIAQRGRRCDWIQNIEADPRVRVRAARYPAARRDDARPLGRPGQGALPRRVGGLPRDGRPIPSQHLISK